MAKRNKSAILNFIKNKNPHGARLINRPREGLPSAMFIVLSVLVAFFVCAEFPAIGALTAFLVLRYLSPSWLT